MSDNSQPVSSRRALREKRRAEMEALLANSQAEQEAKSLADNKETGESERSAKPAKAEAPPVAKSSPKPEAAQSRGAKPVAKPASSANSPAPRPASTTSRNQSRPASTPAAGRPTPPKGAENKSGKSQPRTTPRPKPNGNKGNKANFDASNERESLRRARSREALRERRRLEGEVDALTSHIPRVEPADDPKPLTRRQLRLQALAKQGKTEQSTTSPKPVTKPAKKNVAHDDSPETTVMSVEQALAARRAHSPKEPVDPNLLGEDDSEIDLEVLAHQREMAARAAIISRRAAERERLRVENAKQGKDDKSSDPFTGEMGNFREVEDRIAKTGVKGPKTQSVSLNLNADGKISSKQEQAAPAAKKPAPKPVAKPAPKPVAKPAPKARPIPAPEPKDQASTSATSAAVQMPRIEAVNAQGLEPLDVQTHGVRRANNQLIAMIAALSVGGAALIAGLIMLLGH